MKTFQHVLAMVALAGSLAGCETHQVAMMPTHEGLTMVYQDHDRFGIPWGNPYYYRDGLRQVIKADGIALDDRSKAMTAAFHSDPMLAGR
jgi:hypothetical protein